MPSLMKRGYALRDVNAPHGLSSRAGRSIRNLAALDAGSIDHPFRNYSEDSFIGGPILAAPLQSFDIQGNVFGVRGRAIRVQRLVMVIGLNYYAPGLGQGSNPDAATDAFVAQGPVLSGQLVGEGVAVITYTQNFPPFSGYKWLLATTLGFTDNTVAGEVLLFVNFNAHPATFTIPDPGSGGYHGMFTAVSEPTLLYFENGEGIGHFETVEALWHLGDYSKWNSYVSRSALSTGGTVESFAAAHYANAMAATGGYPDVSQFGVFEGNGTLPLATVQSFFGL